MRPAPSGARRARPGLLSRGDDIHCVFFHLVLLTGYGLAFWIYLHPQWAGLDGPGRRSAFVAAAALMLGWCSGINVGVNFHNHVHRPIFARAWLNRWFGRQWTVCGGWPSLFWAHAHVVVHHSNLLGPTDWTLPRRRPDGTQENIYWYSLVTWPWRYAPRLWADFASGRGGWPRATVGRELAIFLALFSIPFWIDWRMALGLWLLPAWFANAFVMGPGMYAQHADCVPETDERPFRHSNTFVQDFFNLTMFNIGFHIEHHAHPGVHWSVLPKLHDRLKLRLVAGGAHVVPFGYYRAGRLLCRRAYRESAGAEWAAQHADYGPSPIRAGGRSPGPELEGAAARPRPT